MMTSAPNSLLLAEAINALQGFSQAVRKSSAAHSFGGTLHATDLMGALRTLGMTAEVDQVELILRELGTGAVGARDAAMKALDGVLNQLQALSSSPQAESSRAVAVPQVGALDTSLGADNPQQLPRLDDGDAGPDEKERSALSATGLELLQRAREANLAGDDRATESVDAFLSELQDWHALFGGERLADLWRSAHHDLGNLQVDFPVANRLRGLHGFFDSAEKIIGRSYGLIIRLECLGCAPSPAQLDQLDVAISDIGGRFDAIDGKLFLVIPACLARMRMVPFRRQGVIAVLSQAQVLASEPLTGEQAGFLVQIQAGSRALQMQVEALYPAQNMTLTDIPPENSPRRQLRPFAVNGQGDRFEWVLP
jgi:hypothetical protein